MKITDVLLDDKSFITYTLKNSKKTLNVRIKEITDGLYFTALNLQKNVVPVLTDKSVTSVKFKVSRGTNVWVWEDVELQVKFRNGNVYLFLTTKKEGVLENERDSDRIRFIYDTTLTLDKENNDTSYPIEIKNISTKGVGFESHHEFGENIDVKIVLPYDKSTIPVDAKIIREIKKSNSRYEYGSSVNQEGIIKDIVKEQKETL